MFRDMTLGQYYPKDSVIHKLDPRFKLIITFAYIVILFFLNNFVSYAIALAFLIISCVAAKLPMKMLLKNIKPLWFILLLMFIINACFATGGEALFSYGIIRITAQGILRAVMFMFRLVFLILFTSMLTLTTSPMSLTSGLESLMSPLKIVKFPVHEISMMMTIALRFIPTLIEETDKLMKAQMARGASFDTGNIVQKAKSMIPLFIPLFISAFRRADELALAMTARCYNGGEGRTRMNTFKIKKNDYICTLVFTLFFLGMIASEILL